MEAQRGDKHIIINDSPATYASNGIMVYKKMINRIIRYQKLPEDFYEIIRRRKITLSETALAIYLRGKSSRFGNPFTLSNKTICFELNISEKMLRKYRKLLQTKGIIKFDIGDGRKHTTYIMLDTIMIPKMRGAQMVTPGVQHLAPQGVKGGNPSIYKNNDKNKDKKEIRFNPETCRLIKETFNAE